MALGNGDYLQVRDRILATLSADTGAGGLREGDPPVVKTLEGRLQDEPGFYGRYEVPAVLVTVAGKSESPAPNFRSPMKKFAVTFRVVCVGADRETALGDCQKIAHRLEQLCREQNRTANQFQGLPLVVDLAEGALLCSLTRSAFHAASRPETSTGRYAAEGTVEVELLLPCRFE